MGAKKIFPLPSSSNVDYPHQSTEFQEDILPHSDHTYCNIRTHKVRSELQCRSEMRIVSGMKETARPYRDRQQLDNVYSILQDIVMFGKEKQNIVGALFSRNKDSKSTLFERYVHHGAFPVLRRKNKRKETTRNRVTAHFLHIKISFSIH